MNEFLKYQHLERFGTNETEGIQFGECYVFPKIDGTNGSIWHDGNIQAGSRRRYLTLDYDNQGFYEWVLKQDNIADFFRYNPNLRLYGEWLVPHTLKTYQPEAWNRFYVFDVMEGDEYLPYNIYQPVLERFNIDYIPPVCIIKNPSYDRLIQMLEKSTFLIEDGKGAGEGIVVKNYDYKNKYGRVTWAKIVRNEFKSAHQKCQPTEVKEKKLIEEEIVSKYVTNTLIEKELAKITAENGWSSKFIPRLLNTVYYCLVKEECWNFVKDFKNPSVDFKRLQYLTNHHIKTIKPELF